jgi:hypothetical protein
MFFHDDDFDGPSYALKNLLERVKDLRGQRWITLKESEELEKLEQELDAIRAKCSHIYRIVMLFNGHRRFCKLCDKEDMTYRFDR